MLSRERVRRAVRFERPDVPPLLHGIVGGRRAHDPVWAQEIYHRFPDDFGIEDDDTLMPVNKDYFTKGEPFVDGWGCTRQCMLDGLQSSIIEHPLADASRLADYEPPVPERAPYEAIDARIRAAGHPRYVRLGIGGLFDKMQALRGMEALFLDLLENPGFVRDLADMIFGVLWRNVEFICETEVDCVYLGDDWGTERALMVSPNLWRDFFKPYYAKIVDHAHARDKDVWLHSCGQIADIVPDFIEIGIDVLHPQMEMLMQDPAFLPTVQGRLCLETDIARNWPVDSIERRRIRCYGCFPGGHSNSIHSI